jgi:ribonuclease HII
VAEQPLSDLSIISFSMELIAGLDEAGRGAAIGPMTVAAVFVREQDIDWLRELGVGDSKQFGSDDTARQHRKTLAERIRGRSVSVIIQEADAAEVDRWVRKAGLNHLERSMALRIFEQGPQVSRAAADGLKVFGPLASELTFLTAIDRADEKDPVVAAASIVAKDRRDFLFGQIIERHEPQFGPVRGGGYANAATERFLRAYHEKHGTLPPETRLTWTWPVIQDLLGTQTKLPLG